MQVASRYTKFLLWPSLILVFTLLMLQWLQYRFVIVEAKTEVYAGSIAILFLILGYFISSQLQPKQTKFPEAENGFTNVEVELATSGSDALSLAQPDSDLEGLLSQRELEVLQLMAKGYSNLEISEQLFISLSTVKTHCSSIYIKLDVKRRTGAVERARSLGLLN